MRIIQAGLGAWGASWLGVIRQSPHWELAAVVDVNQELADATAAQWGVPAHASVESALRETGADAVLVVAPPPFHAPVAIAALEGGASVLIEKPLAHTLDDARRIIAASDAANGIAMVSQNYRFKRAPRTVQRLISEGVIGDVQQVFINYQKNPPFEGFRLTMEDPLIVDMMIHHVDQMRGIAGVEPVDVRAVSWNPSWSQFQGNASAMVLMSGSRGEQIVYTGSWTSQGEHTSWDGDWDIQGTRGAISWRNNRVEIRFASLFDTVFLPGALERSGVMEVDLDVLAEEERLGTLGAFAAAVETGTRPETDVHDNILTLQLALATAASAKAGGTAVPLLSADELLA
jgi:predicted dehydrogenase